MFSLLATLFNTFSSGARVSRGVRDRRRGESVRMRRGGREREGMGRRKGREGLWG